MWFRNRNCCKPLLSHHCRKICLLCKCEFCFCYSFKKSTLNGRKWNRKQWVSSYDLTAHTPKHQLMTIIVDHPALAVSFYTRMKCCKRSSFYQLRSKSSWGSNYWGIISQCFGNWWIISSCANIWKIIQIYL